MPLCKKPEPKKFELRFMNLCTEGCYDGIEPLEQLWKEAEAEGQLNQIYDAADEEGETAIQKCAKFGNPRVLAWVIEKWQSKKTAGGEPDP